MLFTTLRLRLITVFVGCVLVVGLGYKPLRSQTQSATVRGYVTDSTSGTPLQGVNVTLTDAADQFFGAATNRDGFFVLSGLPAGRYAIRASFVGYTPYLDSLSLTPGTGEHRNISLTPDETQLNTLIIEDEHLSGASNLSAGLQEVQPRDIELVPAPSISGDLATYMTTLPGVITTGDRGGQFFIRGGEASQNLVLIDGMLVYQPFHILGFYSAFPTEIINQVDFYAGGFGGRYGGRLASVIDVSTRNGNKNHTVGSATLSPFISSIHLEGPINLPNHYLSLFDENKTSILFSARHSLLGVGASRLVDAALPFVFNDFFAKMHTTLSRKSQFSISALRTYDRGTLSGGSTERPPEALQWENEAYGGRYLYTPVTRPLIFEFGITLSRLRSRFGPSQNPSRFSLVERYNSYANITYFTPRTEVSWGVFARTIQVNSQLGGLFQNYTRDKEFLTEVGIYLESLLKLNSGLTLTPGMRIHVFPSKERTFFEPRLRMNWNQGRYQFNAAAGLYHQNMVGLNDRRDASGIFTVWTATPFRDIPRAFHGIIGHHVQLSDHLEGVVETYYKRLSNLFVAEWTAFPRFTTQLQQARGRVYGLDLRLELRRSHFYGYLTYGLSSVEYEALQPALSLWYGVEALRYRPGHDRRHQINALASTTWKRFDFGVRWQFGSGLPYNRAFGFDGFVLVDDAIDVFETPGNRRVIYERPFNGILPTYHRLDLSAERTLLRPWGALTFQASLINVYNRSNLFYLDLFTLRREDQLPFIPSFGLKVAFR